MSTKKYTKEEVNELNAISAQLFKLHDRLCRLELAHRDRTSYDGFCIELFDIAGEVTQAFSKARRLSNRIEEYQRLHK